MALALVAGTVSAQQTEVYTFRLAKDPANIGSCGALDASLAREHTLAIVGGKARIKGAGGVDDNMKPAGAGLRRAELSLGRVGVTIEADVGKTPRTLLASAPREGCKWSGTSP